MFFAKRPGYFPKSNCFRMALAFSEFRSRNAFAALRQTIFRQGEHDLLTAFGASPCSNAGPGYKLPGGVHAERSSK